MLCSQGNLDECKKVKLEEWKRKSLKTVDELATKAKVVKRKEMDKKKDKVMNKINGIVSSKVKQSKEERGEQRKIEERANRLAKEIVNNKDMNAQDKMDSMVSLKKQVNDLVT